MKPELEKLCQDFISNRDAVGKAFRWDNSALHTVCANIFCAHGETADTERLKECLPLSPHPEAILQYARLPS